MALCGQTQLIAPSVLFRQHHKPVQGHSWCTCASACFLIWASGVTREGGHVGIHRISWSGSDFGKLSTHQAREQYTRAESDYRAYVSRLNVPTTIVDRMFATGSCEIHYLSWPDLQLIHSTPYLGELVLARCGVGKHQKMSAANNWTSREDPVHVECYRKTLKETMLTGTKVYLQKYGG